MEIESGQGHGSQDSLDGSSSTISLDHSESGLMGGSSSCTETDKVRNRGAFRPSDDAEFLQCPMEDISFGRALYDRSSWLISLLLFQSCSSYILADNVDLLQSHPAIIFYLTMLVGAGGNAGNQAAVRIIRGMAIGKITEVTKYRILLREVAMGAAMCLLLSLIGFLRVHFAAHTSTNETIAITLSLSAIVFFSVIIGSLLPFFLKFMGFDPVHASTSIQVVMDISGVLITCFISALILKQL